MITLTSSTDCSDVILVGAGIMRATLAVILKELDPIRSIPQPEKKIGISLFSDLRPRSTGNHTTARPKGENPHDF